MGIDKMKDMEDKFAEVQNRFLEKKNEIDAKEKSVDEKRHIHVTNVVSEYKNSEQNRIIYIVYGTALTNVVAINSLGQHPNVTFFIAALVWSLAAYVIWLYMERWAFYSRTIKVENYYLNEMLELRQKTLDNLGDFFKQIDPNNLAKDLQLHFINKINEEISAGKENFARYNNKMSENQRHTDIAEITYALFLIISWIFSLIARLCTFVYITFIPVCLGEIAIYTSLIVLLVSATISIYKRRKLSLLLRGLK